MIYAPDLRADAAGNDELHYAEAREMDRAARFDLGRGYCSYCNLGNGDHFAGCRLEEEGDE